MSLDPQDGTNEDYYDGIGNWYDLGDYYVPTNIGLQNHINALRDRILPDSSSAPGYGDIETGYGNDDRLMEQALDTEEATMAGRKAFLEAHASRIMDEIEKLGVLGEDVYEDDNVLSIKYNHGGGTDYTYIALKAGGKWYLSGYQNQGPMSWDKMLEFFTHGEIIGMWVVTSWERVV